VAAVTVKVNQSRSVFVGEDFDTLYEIKETRPQLGAPLALFTGDYHQVIGGSWNTGGQICIQQSNPWPVQVLALVPEIQIGDP
jgi:hypothetical protein